MSKNKFIDLSHKITEKIPVFQGIPSPKIYPYLTHSESAERYAFLSEFELTKIEMVTSVGTYLDSPYHRFKDMYDISEIELEDVVIEGVLVNSKGKMELYPEIVEDDVKGKAVLINTGWSRYWGEEKYFKHPYVTKELAEYFVEKKVKLVGIDTLNIDNPSDLNRPAHTILLKNKILIVENLCNLHLLGGKRFRFFAVPLKIKAAAIPVRAFAEVML